MKTTLATSLLLLQLFGPYVGPPALAQTSTEANEPAGCLKKREFKFSDEAVILCLDRSSGAWLSPVCFKKANRVCGALILRKEAEKSRGGLPFQKVGKGQNPAAVVCQTLGGKERFATLSGGSQIGFCQSTVDQTFIDFNALGEEWHY